LCLNFSLGVSLMVGFMQNYVRLFLVLLNSLADCLIFNLFCKFQKEANSQIFSGCEYLASKHQGAIIPKQLVNEMCFPVYHCHY
jgi:hypothetical protein